MRDFIFRAFDKKTNSMIRFVFSDLESNLFTITELVSRNNWTNPIMQYLGFKDKNNKEVFESDILEVTNYSEEKERYLVKYCEECAAFIMHNINNDQQALFSDDWFSEIEVIGNIYMEQQNVR